MVTGHVEIPKKKQEHENNEKVKKLCNANDIKIDKLEEGTRGYKDKERKHDNEVASKSASKCNSMKEESKDERPNRLK